MNTAPRLDDAERQRLLQAMGFDIWVKRGSEPLRANSPAAVRQPPAERVASRAAVTPEPRRVESTAPARSAPSMERSVAAESTARIPAAASTFRMSAQSVLLILEKRVHADAPMVRHLMLALPGCMICTADTVSRGAAKFALQLGVEAALPADVLGVRAPALAALQHSASARRSLWWSIKPMLKALRA
jgi:hypothetical protein